MNQTEQKTLIDLLYKKYNKVFLSKSEAARELGLSQSTIDRMRRNGELKASKLKGSIHFSITEIARFA